MNELDIKHLSKNIFKPFGTTIARTLSSINPATPGAPISTDAGITKEYEILRARIAGSPEGQDTPTPKTAPEAIRIKGILKDATREDALEAVRALSGSAAAPDIPAKLMKIACLRNVTIWTRKTTKELATDAYLNSVRDGKTAEETMRRWLHNRHIGRKCDIIPPEVVQDPLLYKRKTIPLTRAVDLLAHIMTLSFQTRNIPDAQKTTTITTTPKEGGMVTSLDAVRPISVSPIVGRLINHVVAHRLGKEIVRKKIMDAAQFAFLPGMGIHEAIQSVLLCLRKSKNTPINQKGKEIHAIFYDISKAYDTVKWSSILQALVDIGADNDLIEYVHNTLKGSRNRIKTHIPGRTTTSGEIYGSIKQGCPLAPLLFVILMDELHRNCRAIGGYPLDNGEDVSLTATTASNGYCDDACVLADSRGKIEKLNEVVAAFFHKHGFIINAKIGKSQAGGFNADGSIVTEGIRWPGTDMIIEPLGPSESFRYLGLYMTMDLQWETHIQEMNACILKTLSALRHWRVTLLQGCQIITKLLEPKLEIGMRHAIIPHKTLQEWDRQLSAALIRRAGLSAGSIHQSATITLISATGMVNLNYLNKVTDILSRTNKATEGLPFYRKEIDKCLKIATLPEDTSTDRRRKVKAILLSRTDLDILKVLQDLDKVGITIIANPRGEKKAPRIRKKSKPTDGLLTFRGQIVPVQSNAHRGCYDLWGSAYPRAPDTDHDIPWVTICTDGSTYKGKPFSGAAMVYVQDNFHKHEWEPRTIHWNTAQADNHCAEMAAINRALRSVPVTAHIRLFTDSSSCIAAIKQHGTRKGLYLDLRDAARPYLRAIQEAMEVRNAAGAITEIKHIRSHTGNRDPQSIGNECADRGAKEAANNGTLGGDIDLMEYELPYVLLIDGEPVHGDIRKALKNHLKNKTITTWGDQNKRPTRGRIARDHPGVIRKLIETIWKAPSSTDIKFLIETLNGINPKDYGLPFEKTRTTQICNRCGEGTPATVLHRLVECHAVAHIWNGLDKEIWALLTCPDDTLQTNRTGTDAQTYADTTVERQPDILDKLSKTTLTTIATRCLEIRRQNPSSQAPPPDTQSAPRRNDTPPTKAPTEKRKNRPDKSHEYPANLEILNERDEALKTLNLRDPIDSKDRPPAHQWEKEDLCVGHLIGMQGAINNTSTDDPHPWVGVIRTTTTKEISPTRQEIQDADGERISPKHVTVITVQWLYHNSERKKWVTIQVGNKSPCGTYAATTEFEGVELESIFNNNLGWALDTTEADHCWAPTAEEETTMNNEHRAYVTLRFYDKSENRGDWTRAKKKKQKKMTETKNKNNNTQGKKRKHQTQVVALGKKSITHHMIQPPKPIPTGDTSNRPIWELDVDQRRILRSRHIHNILEDSRTTGFLVQPTTIPKMDPDHSVGCFCTRDLENETEITDYTGESITEEEFNRRKTITGYSERHVYPFMGMYIDAGDPRISSAARYINHSAKNPNVTIRTVDGKPKIFTIMPIKAGTELFRDYTPDHHKWETEDPKEPPSTTPLSTQETPHNPTSKRRKVGKQKQTRMGHLNPAPHFTPRPYKKDMDSPDPYEWQDLMIRPATRKGKNIGDGLFAKREIQKSCAIPFVGNVRPKMIFRKDNPLQSSHQWVYLDIFRREVNAAIDGKPDRPGVACGRGLGMAMIANEPRTKNLPNCRLHMNHLITLKTIAKGEELTVYYGDQDITEITRRAAGYTLDLV